MRNGKLTFVYNNLALERFTFAGREPLPKGKAQLKVDFAYKGGAEERGKGAVKTSQPAICGGRVCEHCRLSP